MLAYNYVLICAAVSWAAAQIIKTLLHTVKTKNFVAERLFGSGGMPSSHSSFVTATVFAMGRKVGIGSPLFALSFVIAAVVIYDAMGVRYAAGQQAKRLNNISRYLKKVGLQMNKTDENETVTVIVKDEGEKELKEYLGHTPLEVAGGILLGIVVAFLVPIK